MKSITILLMLAIFSLSAATAASAPKERPATKKEKKRSLKQEKISAAYKLLKSHYFAIFQYSYYSRDHNIGDPLIICIDKNETRSEKLIYEKFDPQTNTYSLVYFCSFPNISNGERFSNYKLSLNLDSGFLEIRSYITHERRFITETEVEQQKGYIVFRGDHTNVYSADKLYGRN